MRHSVTRRNLPLLILMALPSVLPLASARADGPAVSAVNGKISGEGGVSGNDGDSSAIGMVSGSFSTPLGHSFGLQVDGTAGTAFNNVFGGGTAHLFWRDPAIGLLGPVATLQTGGGARLGWYGVEGELYAGLFTFGAWGGYHDVTVGDRFGTAASTGFYGGRATVYPIPDLALSIGATSAFSRVIASGTLEFQPDGFARHNTAFYVSGDVGEGSTYSLTAGVRFYFGTDKPLIRRHREDDPPSGVVPAAADEVSALIAAQFATYGQQYQTSSAQADQLHQQFVSHLP